jgi:hypothetical protein
MGRTDSNCTLPIQMRRLGRGMLVPRSATSVRNRSLSIWVEEPCPRRTPTFPRARARVGARGKLAAGGPGGRGKRRASLRTRLSRRAHAAFPPARAGLGCFVARAENGSARNLAPTANSREWAVKDSNLRPWDQEKPKPPGVSAGSSMICSSKTRRWSPSQHDGHRDCQRSQPTTSWLREARRLHVKMIWPSPAFS